MTNDLEQGTWNLLLRRTQFLLGMKKAFPGWSREGLGMDGRMDGRMDQATSTCGSFHTLLAYSRMVRSELKKPTRAVLSTVILVQRSGCL